MKFPLVRAVLAVAAIVCAAAHARADCVIAPDNKSIDVVTDNPSSDEKNCAVKCQVDTKIGVVQVSCGGNAPPLAKGYSLCAFDKPEPWYKKVISAENSCKEMAGAAPAAAPIAAAPPPAAADASGFSCRISADGKTVDTMIANPYKVATSCQVDCRVSSTRGGVTHGISCTKTVQPGVGQAVICSHTYDNERLVKMVSGNGQCIDPTPAAAETKQDEDEDADVQNLAKDPAKLQDFIRKQLNRKN